MSQPDSFGKLDFASLTAVLQFLKTKTKSSLIQAPSITALDNQEATIHIGKVIRYASATTQSASTGGATTTYTEASNSPVREGVQLLVVPHVTGPDCNVLMTIVVKTERLDPSKNAADGFRNFGGPTGIDLPQTSQQVVVTKELLRDSETSVIGGLKRDTAGFSETKIPFLGDIPILGWLFKSRSTSGDRQNLMVFVTPTIIDFQKEDRMARMAREIRRDLTGPFFGYEEKSPEAPPAAGAGGGNK
jgi:general secretion pathway protein D